MLAQWVEEALDHAGMTQAQLGRALTDVLGRSIDRAAVNKMVKGTRLLKADEMVQIAAITGHPAPAEDDEAGTVPLKGYVGAGAAFYAFDPGGDLGRVPTPDGATEYTVAVEIRGESLGELFDRWLVYYDEVRTPPTREMIGHLCVVGLRDGRILVKKIKPGQLSGHFTLLSNTEPPIYDVLVDWCAKVKQMSPR